MRKTGNSLFKNKFVKVIELPQHQVLVHRTQDGTKMVDVVCLSTVDGTTELKEVIPFDTTEERDHYFREFDYWAAAGFVIDQKAVKNSWGACVSNN